MRLGRTHPFAVRRVRRPESQVRGVQLARHEADDAREHGVAGGVARRRQVPVPDGLPVDAVHAPVVEPVPQLRPRRAERQLPVVGQVVLAVHAQVEHRVLVRRLVVHHPREPLVLRVPAGVAPALGRQLFARHAVRDVQRVRGRAVAVGERAGVVREERRGAGGARAPDAVEQPVEHDVHAWCALVFFVLIFVLLVFVLVLLADVAASAPDGLRLVLLLVLGVKVDVVDLVVAVADARPVAGPGEQLAVRTPRRRPVPLPVPRQVVRFSVARRGDDPHVAVAVGVHEFRRQVARVWTPADGAGGVCLRPPLRLHVLQRHHVDLAALVRAGEARAVGREVQPDAHFVVRDQRLGLERRVLPPRQGTVGAARAADVRAVAAVQQIVQARPVGRERALRHAREAAFRDEARRLDDGVHRVQAAAHRQRHLETVGTERDVASALGVPCRGVEAAAAEGGGGLVAARSERDAHGLGVGRRRVKAPEVEPGPHHHRMAVR